MLLAYLPRPIVKRNALVQRLFPRGEALHEALERRAERLQVRRRTARYIRSMAQHSKHHTLVCPMLLGIHERAGPLAPCLFRRERLDTVNEQRVPHIQRVRKAVRRITRTLKCTERVFEAIEERARPQLGTV